MKMNNRLLLIYVLLNIFMVSASTSCSQTVQKNTGDSSSVWSISLKDFVSRSGQHHADILGGAVSITEGVLATSVIMMALDVSKLHEKDSAKRRSLGMFIDSLQTCQDTLVIVADKDRTLFKKYLASSQLPAGTPDEKHVRDSTVYSSLLDIARSPVESARIMLKVLEISKDAVFYCSNITMSDATASAHLIHGSLNACLSIAAPDIFGLSGTEKIFYDDKCRQYRKRSDMLLQQIQELAKKIQ